MHVVTLSLGAACLPHGVGSRRHFQELDCIAAGVLGPTAAPAAMRHFPDFIVIYLAHGVHVAANEVTKLELVVGHRSKRA